MPVVHQIGPRNPFEFRGIDPQVLQLIAQHNAESARIKMANDQALGQGLQSIGQAIGQGMGSIADARNKVSMMKWQASREDDKLQQQRDWHVEDAQQNRQYELEDYQRKTDDWWTQKNAEWNHALEMHRIGKIDAQDLANLNAKLDRDRQVFQDTGYDSYDTLMADALQRGADPQAFLQDRMGQHALFKQRIATEAKRQDTLARISMLPDAEQAEELATIQQIEGLAASLPQDADGGPQAELLQSLRDQHRERILAKTRNRVQPPTPQQQIQERQLVSDGFLHTMQPNGKIDVRPIPQPKDSFDHEFEQATKLLTRKKFNADNTEEVILPTADEIAKFMQTKDQVRQAVKNGQSVTPSSVQQADKLPTQQPQAAINPEQAARVVAAQQEYDALKKQYSSYAMSEVPENVKRRVQGLLAIIEGR